MYYICENWYRYTDEKTGKPRGYDRTVMYEEEYTTKDEAKAAYFKRLSEAGMTIEELSAVTVPYVGKRLKSGKMKPAAYFRDNDKNLLLV